MTPNEKPEDGIDIGDGKFFLSQQRFLIGPLGLVQRLAVGALRTAKREVTVNVNPFLVKPSKRNISVAALPGLLRTS